MAVRGYRKSEMMGGGGGIGNFTRVGGIFLSGEGNLRRIDFDNSNLFQSEKQLSVNTEHQLKSK